MALTRNGTGELMRKTFIGIISVVFTACGVVEVPAGLSGEAAADALRQEVRAGRLDGEAVNAVLAVAGHRVPARRREWVAGLSDREVEVLRLVAQGLTNEQVAERLVISARTVDTHLTSIYSKIGVSSRVSATRYAMQHHLV